MHKSPTAASSCPAAYLPPDPRRPQVTLAFSIGEDHRTVTGSERVAFTPDQPVTELVYRLWPNGRDHLVGGSLTVSKAQVQGRPTALQLSSAGGRAGTPGTLLTLPLGRTAPAGQPIVSVLDFTLRLPVPLSDRIGSDGHTAWWGTGAPLLAWVRGSGWVRTPGSSTLADMAVSEAARTEITVTAPADDTVLATGTPSAPVVVSPTRRRWHFVATAARDVAVAVGRLSIAAATVATPSGPVAVRVAAAPGLEGTAKEVLQQVRRLLPLQVQHFGGYPFSALAVAVLPGLGASGIEYPGMFLLGNSGDQSVTAHELVHMWFYGLVGDDQELHPWLDEAFATAGEQLIDAQLFGGWPLANDPAAVADPRPVDSPLSAFERDQLGYYNVVYFKGATAIIAARQQAGTAKFDATLRCYLKAHAWQVATPAAVATALHSLPSALTVLRKAGAIH